MTVESLTTFTGPYTANGVTTAFPFDFAVATVDDIIIDAAPSIPFAYSATIDASGTGTLTFASPPASGTILYLRSDPSFRQEVVLENQGRVQLSVLDEVNDSSVRRDLWLRAGVLGSLRAPAGETLGALPASADRQGAFLGFDASGDPVVLSGTGSDAALRTDLADGSGAALIGVASGQSLQDLIDDGFGGGVSIKTDGATGDGSTVDTINMQSAITAAPVGATITVPPGEYASIGVAMPTGKAFRLSGIGGPVLRATSAGVLLAAPADQSLPDGQQNIVEGITFRGNAAAGDFGYTAGTTGLKWGNGATIKSVINPTTRDCKFLNLEVGIHHYATQEAFDVNTVAFRCFVGELIESDPAAGGATASVSTHATRQYCQIGIFGNNAARTSFAIKGTLASGSAAVTGVADTTGIVAGLKVIARGVPAGTTVAGSITGTGFTMSAAATVATTVTNVPMLISNNGGFDTGWRWDGASTIQGNYVCGMALFGMAGIYVGEGTHFETNNVGSPSPLTYKGRTVPAVPIYLHDTQIEFDGAIISESVGGGIPAVLAVAGSRVRVEDCTLPACLPQFRVDGTSTLEFYGQVIGAFGTIVDGHVARWPDSIGFSSSAAAIGNPAQINSRSVPNQSTNPSPRVPVLTATGAATLAYAVDSDGVWSTAAFTGAGSNANAVYYPLLNGTVVVGDQVGVWLTIKADRYTDVTIQISNGSGGTLFQNLRVTPYPQRLFHFFSVLAAGGSHNIFIYPTGSDGPTLYLANDMQVRVPPGGSIEPISQVLGKGLFDPKSDDGALNGSVTVDLASIASGATGAEQTITVPGAALGNFVRVTCSIDSAGLAFDARVSAAGTVKFIPRNPTAGAIDLASATYTARVLT